MDFKTYAKSRQTVVCLELERVKLLLEKSGKPDDGMKIIHVAGTNGKGSVCAFVCAGLSAMGKNWGKFSSPELVDITDTIVVNSCPISHEELDDIYSFLSPLCDVIEKETGKAPSQFEINFVAALVHFKNKGCTHVCLECGMGGAGDATNAIGDSFVSAIAKISFDHMDYLGDTLEKICENKCGIFKKSSRVVTGFQTPEIREKIKELARDRNFVYAKELHCEGFYDFSEIVSFEDEKNIRLSLHGVNQVQNASIAAEVLKCLGADSSHIRFALENAKNPARLEKTEDKVYFDGAHNPDGVKALSMSISRYVGDKKIIFVAGFMKDKEYKKALFELSNIGKDICIYAVPVKGNPRSAKAEDIKNAAEELGFESKAFENVSDAVAVAKENADLVFVMGSLYMYKEYLEGIKE